MRYQIEFPIGDWSDDGHGKHTNYIIETDRSVQEVREVHFKIEDVLGFKLGDICADTENITIDPGIISKMNEIGLDEEYFNRNSEGDYYIDSPDEMVKLWVGILNYIDPGLNLTINKNIRPLLIMLSMYSAK